MVKQEALANPTTPAHDHELGRLLGRTPQPRHLVLAIDYVCRHALRIVG